MLYRKISADLEDYLRFDNDKILIKVLYLPVYFVMFMQAKQAAEMDESELIF